MAEAAIEPEFAVMLAVPTPVPVANPLLAIVATVVGDVLQFTALLRSCLLPSLYVPVAVNGCVVPFAIEALPGLMEIDRSNGAITAAPVAFATVPELALIWAVPIVVPITKPPALTGATAGASEAQITEAVTSSMLPSV